MTSSAPVGSPGSDEDYRAAAFVAGQILLLGAQALLRRRARPPDWGRSTAVRATTGGLALGGGAILAVGSGSLGRGLTVSPLPNDHAQLRTDGLYGLVRHPIYSGVIALSLARTLHSRDRRQVALTAMLIVLLEGKSSFEEKALRQRFAEYSTYAAGTPRFVPVGLKNLSLGRIRRLVGTR
jgi:protein-S-isoprenylcysteine O-methyltransferase Ste14